MPFLHLKRSLLKRKHWSYTHGIHQQFWDFSSRILESYLAVLCISTWFRTFFFFKFSNLKCLNFFFLEIYLLASSMIPEQIKYQPLFAFWSCAQCLNITLGTFALISCSPLSAQFLFRGNSSCSALQVRSSCHWYSHRELSRKSSRRWWCFTVLNTEVVKQDLASVWGILLVTQPKCRALNPYRCQGKKIKCEKVWGEV